MKYFLCKLTGPRPTFPQDMTPREAEIMQAHFAYCGELLRAGKAVVFGTIPKTSTGKIQKFLLRSQVDSAKAISA